MTEHHGLDLAGIQKRLGSHSIFGPSSSAMWLFCSGSLIPNLLADDEANEDAAYGTVGHEVAEIWLNRLAVAKSAATFQSLIGYYRPNDLVGTTRTVLEGSGREFEIEIDDDMLDYVEMYIEWCVEDLGQHMPGVGKTGKWESDIYVEQRIDLSRLMPLPKQGGTADFAACRWQYLEITDLKMGKGVRVFAKENTQAMLYALGFFYEWDWLYNFQRIVIRIAQPRLDHWDVWETTREELLAFADFVKVRAAAAWQLDAPRTPGIKQCQWCRVRGTCAAHAMWLEEQVEGVFENLDDECPVCEGLGCDACRVRIGEDGVIEGVQYTVLEQTAWAENLVSGKRQPLAQLVDRQSLDTEALEKLLPLRPVVEKWFAAIEAELLSRAEAGEKLTRHKLVKGRAGNRAWVDVREGARFMRRHGVEPFDYTVTKLVSPAQAEELLRRKAGLKKKEVAELLNSAVIRPPGRSTLVQLSDDRPVLDPPGDVFDNLDEVDEGL